MQYQFELVNSAVWGQAAGSAYLYSMQMLPFGFARQNQSLFLYTFFLYNYHVYRLNFIAKLLYSLIPHV